MSNKKQTAVQWIVEQMFKQGYFDGNKPLSITNLDHLEYQAKQMEKEQIMRAVKDSWYMAKGSNFQEPQAQQYYNETYKGGEQ